MGSTSRGIISQGGIHEEFRNKVHVGGCIVVNAPVSRNKLQDCLHCGADCAWWEGGCGVSSVGV